MLKFKYVTLALKALFFWHIQGLHPEQCGWNAEILKSISPTMPSKIICFKLHFIAETALCMYVGQLCKIYLRLFVYVAVNF
mgnify:CR=1 FL=1